MSTFQLIGVALSGITAALMFIWGRRVGCEESLSKQEKAAIWAHGHEEGFWNGRLSHGDTAALTGVEHEKATNPFRK